MGKEPVPEELEGCQHGEVRPSFDGCLAICAHCGTIQYALNEKGREEIRRLKFRSAEIAQRAFRKMFRDMGFDNSGNGV